jgi:hypothetical protein
MANNINFTKSLATAASANNIALSQSPGTGAILINGAAATSGVATIDAVTATNNAVGRRVIITSGGNDSGITFTVTGTNGSGNIVSDTFAGASGGAAQSNIDFVTVTGIVQSGSVATTLTAGTNGVGSSPWITWNWQLSPPINIGAAVELVSGAVNYTVQYTYDDPNNLPPGVNFPLAFNTILLNQAATADSTLSTPFIATRVLINSGTGVIRCRFVQAGVG